MTSKTQFVAYYRVSTDKQERSGLGLDAQKQIVEHYVDKYKGLIVKQFNETQSGKGIEKRKELKQALSYCIENNFCLIVAKLDRLSRDVEHTFKIKKQLGSNSLICCDLPNTDSLTLSIFSGLAQREREIISIRTSQALKQLKKKGVKLGKTENFSDEGRAKGRRVLSEKAKNDLNNRKATPLIVEYRKSGLSYNKISGALNENGFTTSKGKKFYASSVKRLYDRYLDRELNGDYLKNC